MKLFEARVAIVPPRWLTVLGAPGHVRQASVAVVAKSKPDAGRMLADTGAWRLDSVLRLTQNPPSKALTVLLASGVIDPSVPGIWAWAAAVNGNAIITVSGSECRVVAYWRYNRGAGIMRIERVSQ